MGKIQSILLILTLGALCPGVALSQVNSLALSDSLKYQGPTFTKKTWSLRSGFEGRNEGKDDGFASLLSVNAQFEMTFTPWLKLEAAPYIAYYSSRVQERFDDDTYQSRMGLGYGHFTLSPVEEVQVKAGAIAQRHLNNSQMISTFRSFPGGLVEYNALPGSVLSGGVRAQYVVPTSSSLNTERQDQEELPTFETQALFLEYKPLDFEVEFQVGRFAWGKLPASVAKDSSQAGNTPAGGDLDPESKLASGFEGWFGSVDGLYKFSNGYASGFKFKRFSNQKAPSNLADSQRLSLVGLKEFDLYGVEIEGGSFFSEADATVAKYSSSGFGNTNRKGQFVKTSLDFKKYRFFVRAEYASAQVINGRSFQDNMNNFSLMVESYAFQF